MHIVKTFTRHHLDLKKQTLDLIICKLKHRSLTVQKEKLKGNEMRIFSTQN